MFEKGAATKCDFDWWSKFQVIISNIYIQFINRIFDHGIVIQQMESGKLT